MLHHQLLARELGFLDSYEYYTMPSGAQPLSTLLNVNTVTSRPVYTNVLIGI